MRPISEDLRERIVSRRKAGESAADISTLFGVSIRSVQRYYRRYLQSGSVSAQRKGRPKGSKLDRHRDRITQWIDKRPDLTLEELCERCRVELDTVVHHTTLLRMLRRWDYRYKKNDSRSRKGTSRCR